MRLWRQCSREGCGAEAYFRPVLLLFSLRDVHMTHPVRLVLDLPVCKGHARAGVPVEALVNDDFWGQTCESLRAKGRDQPVRSLTKVAFERLDAGIDQARANGATG